MTPDVTNNPNSWFGPQLTGDGRMLADHFLASAYAVHLHADLNATILLQFGATELLLSIKNGRLASAHYLSELPPLQSWSFSVKGQLDAWEDFWQQTPKAGSHDIFALVRYGRMKIEGDLHILMANLQTIKNLLACARQQ